MFQRRLIVFIAFLLLALGVLIARLAWLQLFKSEEYITLSQVNIERNPEWLDTTIRGTIYDVRGRALALDEPSYDLYMHYDLTRLYDTYFWELEYSSYLRRNPKKTRADAEAYLTKKYRTQRTEADILLSELSQIMGIAETEMDASVREINERLYTLRLSVARRNY